MVNKITFFQRKTPHHHHHHQHHNPENKNDNLPVIYLSPVAFIFFKVEEKTKPKKKNWTTSNDVSI